MNQWWRISLMNGKTKYIRGEGQPTDGMFSDSVESIAAVGGDDGGPARVYEMTIHGESKTVSAPTLLVARAHVEGFDGCTAVTRDGIPISFDGRTLTRDQQIMVIEKIVGREQPPAIRYAAETLCKTAKLPLYSRDHWDEGRMSALYMVVWTHYIYEGQNLDYYKEEYINDTL